MKEPEANGTSPIASGEFLSPASEAHTSTTGSNSNQSDDASSPLEDSAPSTNQPEPISLKRLLGDTSIYGLVDIIDKSIGFVLMLYLTHVMTTADYGLLGIFGSALSILAIFAGMGMQTTFFRFYSERHDPAGKLRVLTTAVWVAGTNAVFWLGLLVFFTPFVERQLFEGHQGDHLVLLVATCALLDLAYSLGVCRLQADGKSLAYLGVAIVSIITVRGVGFYLIMTGSGVFGWIYGQIFGQLVSTAVMLWLAYRDVRLDVDRKLAGELYVFGLSLVPIALSHWLMKGCDKLIIKEMMPDGLAQVGLYGTGERISSIMDFIVMAFLLGWRRFAFRNVHLPEGQHLLARASTLFVLFVGYAALGLSLLGDDLTHWAINRSFSEGMVVIPVLTMASFFWGLAGIVEIGLYVKNGVGRLAWVNIFVAALNVVLNFALIPSMGIFGSGLATCLCQGLKFLLVWWQSYRLLPLPYEFGRLGTIAGVFVATYLVGQAVNPSVIATFGVSDRTAWLTSTALQAIVVGVCPFLFLVLPFLHAEERMLAGRYGQRIWDRLFGTARENGR